MDRNKAILGKSILIYQDYRGYNLLLEMILKSKGFKEVHTAASMDSAKDMLIKRQFDLLIFDFVNIRGVDLYLQLYKNKVVPYTICTSFESFNVHRYLHSLERIVFLVKPLDIFELQGKVYDVLNQEH